MAGEHSEQSTQPAHRMGQRMDRLAALGCFLLAAFMFLGSLVGISQFFHCSDPFHGCAYVKLGTPFFLIGSIVVAALGRWLWPKARQTPLDVRSP